MACNVDESRSFELNVTIIIIIVIKNFSLYTQKLFSLKHMPRDVVRYIKNQEMCQTSVSEIHVILYGKEEKKCMHKSIN